MVAIVPNYGHYVAYANSPGLCGGDMRSGGGLGQDESSHEKASDRRKLGRRAGDDNTSTRLLLTRLPSRRTLSGVLRVDPAILWSTPTILRPVAVLWSIARLWAAALLWSVARLWSAPAILRSTRLLLRRVTSRTTKRPRQSEAESGMWVTGDDLPSR